MKTRSYLTLSLLLSVGAALSSAIAATGPLTVAIFDFEAADAGNLGKDVSALLNATLSTDANLITVERAELAKVLGEQELSLSGTVSADTAAKVGHLTGAKVLVTGRVFKLATRQ